MKYIYLLTLFFLTSCLSMKQDYKTYSSKMENKKADGKEFVISTAEKAISNNLIRQNPLVIIDAIALDNKETEQVQYSILYKDDIENIAVLESEKAIPIYGEKGKNGLVLVTRKKKAQKYLEYYLKRHE